MFYLCLKCRDAHVVGIDSRGGAWLFTLNGTGDASKIVKLVCLNSQCNATGEETGYYIETFDGKREPKILVIPAQPAPVKKIVKADLVITCPHRGLSWAYSPGAHTILLEDTEDYVDSWLVLCDNCLKRIEGFRST
jgi:hypothetical protein